MRLSQAYDRLRSENPGGFDKIKIVHGDCTRLGLGLSDEDRETLHREVGVVFHGAASVRFDEPLSKAVLLNVRGTREVVELAKGMLRLKVRRYTSLQRLLVQTYGASEVQALTQGTALHLAPETFSANIWRCGGEVCVYATPLGRARGALIYFCPQRRCQPQPHEFFTFFFIS